MRNQDRCQLLEGLVAMRLAAPDFDQPWPKLPGSPTDVQQLEAFRRAAARLNGKRPEEKA